MQADLDQYPVADSGALIDGVPVIDVAALVADVESAEARSAVDAIAEACREWGFFQVVNHGISVDLVGATWQETRRFFAAPADIRRAIMRTRENPWGYYNNELTKNKRDKKEVFDYTTDGRDPIYGAANRWPLLGDRFRSVLCEYRDACTVLSLKLLEAFCVGLDLPPAFMQDDFARSHTGFIRLNYYPVRDPLDGTDSAPPEADLGVHHHSDAGALTVLLQDAVGGLQVFRDGYWHNIPPIEGALVVNTGDMMQVWSNDYYQAAVHRVLAMQETDRYSIPFFFNPTADTIVTPLPTTVSDSRPARYRPVPWSDFRARRTDGDYADYGPEVQIADYRTSNRNTHASRTGRDLRN